MVLVRHKRYIAPKEDKRNLSTALVGKPAGKKLFSSFGCGWEKLLKSVKFEVGRILLKRASGEITLSWTKGDVWKHEKWF
jgi:hypothetical protein